MGVLIPAQIAAARGIVHHPPRPAGRGAACLDAVALLSFTDHPEPLQSRLALSSVVACYDAYLSPSEAGEAWAELAAYFHKYKHTVLPEMGALRSPAENIERISGQAVSTPILVNRASWIAGVRTEAEWDRQVYLVRQRGGGLTAAPCLWVGDIRAPRCHCCRRPYWSPVGVSEAHPDLPREDVYRLPPTYLHTRRVWAPAPPRNPLFCSNEAAVDLRGSSTPGQLTQISLYLLLNVVWSCLGYHTFDDNLL